MTPHDEHDDAVDLRRLTDLACSLPVPDVDAVTSERIARRARQDIGKPRSIRILTLAIVAVGATVLYAVWMITQILLLLGSR